MKVIGLLGGMSWESSIEYYRLVNERAKAVLGGFHSAHTVLYSVDFAAIERMQADGRWDDAGAELNRAAKALEAAGADFVVLCTNTMHKVADQLEDGLGIPLLHLGDATAAAIEAAGSACSAPGSPWGSRSTATGSPRTASTCSCRAPKTAISCTG